MKSICTKVLIATLMASCMTFLLAMNSEASSFRLYKGGFGVKIGFINSGTIHIRNKITDNVSDFETDSDMSYGVFFDIPIKKKIGISLDIDIHEISRSVFSGNVIQQEVINFSIGIKTVKYNAREKIAFRPGISIGYAFLQEMRFIEKSNLLTLRASGELIFITDKKYGFLVELSILYSPYGVSKNYYITTSPIFLLRAGFIF